MKNKILCIQISTNLINDKQDLTDISQLYYNTLYKVKSTDGYIKPSDFWEIPLWVTEINHNIETDFYICTNIKDTIKFIDNSNYDYVLFSVLDTNKSIIYDIIQDSDITNKTFILGGYIDFVYFASLPPVFRVVRSIKQFIESLGIKYKQGNSYKLFKSFKTIPRLTLSTGCLNNCDFCTVENKITKINTHIIEQQIKAFKPLKFKLIYINDKTFGQSTNYKLLPRIYKAIKEYNKKFIGFIIQTTTGQLLKISNNFIKEAHIKYIELGVESWNDAILKQYHKPSTEMLCIRAFEKIQRLYPVKVIPNIIIGMPEESKLTYSRTIEFLTAYKTIISHLNIYNLAVYDNTELAKRIKPSNSNSNELKVNTWKQCNVDFYNSIHKLGIDILKGE